MSNAEIKCPERRNFNKIVAQNLKVILKEKKVRTRHLVLPLGYKSIDSVRAIMCGKRGLAPHQLFHLAIFLNTTVERLAEGFRGSNG